MFSPKAVKALFFLLLVLSFSQTVRTQEDPARNSSQLPTKIGPDRNSSKFVKVSGTLRIDGIENLSKVPVFLVSIIVNGKLLDRREVKDRGAFMFPNVPLGSDAELLVEADNFEVKRISNLISAVAPITGVATSGGTTVANPGGRNRQNSGAGDIQPVFLNTEVRQDISINWQEINRPDKKPSVIDVRDFYQRTDENQKLFDKAVDESQSKKKDAAIALFKQLVERDDKDFVAWAELGTLYFINEKYSDAEKCYQQSLALNARFGLALLNLGKLYLAQKDPDKAIEILTRAVAADAASADANHYLGEAYLMAKKGSKAVGYLNEAIRLAPLAKAEVHLRLAALYDGAGLKDRAALEYQKFLEKVPDFEKKKELQKYIKENLPK
ncbi:MAG: tetratricopeptide repeat protein [Acidobacteria bacterium]|nr:tetratricopeptide repeat protein [Acidobacteriota bacterium]